MDFQGLTYWSINDTTIIFQSQIAINSDTDIFGGKEAAKSFFDVDYSGSKKSAMREAWNELDAIARKFGDHIVYSKYPPTTTTRIPGYY